VGAARATLTLEDSEWSRKFEEPWQEGWGIFFSKAASKGLPDPLTRQGGDALRPLHMGKLGPVIILL
jgi:hypothetical protein